MVPTCAAKRLPGFCPSVEPHDRGRLLSDQTAWIRAVDQLLSKPGTLAVFKAGGVHGHGASLSLLGSNYGASFGPSLATCGGPGIRDSHQIGVNRGSKRGRASSGRCAAVRPDISTVEPGRPSLRPATNRPSADPTSRRPSGTAHLRGLRTAAPVPRAATPRTLPSAPPPS